MVVVVMVMMIERSRVSGQGGRTPPERGSGVVGRAPSQHHIPSSAASLGMQARAPEPCSFSPLQPETGEIPTSCSAGLTAKPTPHPCSGVPRVSPAPLSLQLPLTCFPRGGSEEPEETELQHGRQQAASRATGGREAWESGAVHPGPNTVDWVFCPARHENGTISPLSCAASLSSPRYPDLSAVEREGTGS